MNKTASLLEACHRLEYAGTYSSGTTNQLSRTWNEDANLTLEKIHKAMSDIRPPRTILIRKSGGALWRVNQTDKPQVVKDPLIADHDPFTFYCVAGFGVVCGQCVYATVKKMRVVWSDTIETAGELI